MENLVLEPSTNTHVINGDIVSKEKISEHVIALELRGAGVVTHGNGVVQHGKHGTIKTESPYVVKYTQQELNPISKKMTIAFD